MATIDIVKLFINIKADMQVMNYYEPRSTDFVSLTAAVECYKHIIELKEWRPWNASKYSSMYQDAMKTLVLLAKAC